MATPSPLRRRRRRLLRRLRLLRRAACACFSASSHGCACLVPSATVAASSLAMKSSSVMSVSPPAREIEVPFHGFDRIARGAEPAGENARVAVLRDRAAVLRGLVEDRGGGVLVARHAVAVIERDGVFDLARRCRRRATPPPTVSPLRPCPSARRGRPCRRCRARIAPAGCRRRRRGATIRRRA